MDITLESQGVKGLKTSIKKTFSRPDAAAADYWKFGLMFLVLFVLGATVVSHFQVRVEKQARERTVMTHGRYLIRLISLYPLLDMSGEERDVLFPSPQSANSQERVCLPARA